MAIRRCSRGGYEVRDGQASVVGCPSPISHLPSPISQTCPRTFPLIGMTKIARRNAFWKFRMAFSTRKCQFRIFGMAFSARKWAGGKVGWATVRETRFEAGMLNFDFANGIRKHFLIPRTWQGEIMDLRRLRNGRYLWTPCAARQRGRNHFSGATTRTALRRREHRTIRRSAGLALGE